MNAHRRLYIGDARQYLGSSPSSPGMLHMGLVVLLILAVSLLCYVRRSNPDKPQKKSKVITAEEADRRCPATTCEIVGDAPYCVVCLCQIENGEICRELQCGHTFHANCIMSWWMIKPRKSITCPLCRQEQSNSTALGRVPNDVEGNAQEDQRASEDQEQLDLALPET